MTRAVVRAMAVALVLIGGGRAVEPAAAQDDDIEPRFAAPVVIVNQTTLEPGDEVVVTIAGFRSRSVTAFICGNDARRGSSDCDNIGATTAELRADGSSTVVDMLVGVPPLPCPCVVRVASPDGDEVAVARVTIVGHPTAPVVGGEFSLAEPLAVGISATRASSGFVADLFASLGGATSYDVTVTVRNRGTDDVSGVVFDSWAGRGDRVVRSFEVDLPPTIAAGETVEDVVRVELPAPHLGSADWLLEVGTPNAPTVRDAASTSNLPWLLYVLLAVLVFDLVLLAVRLLRRLVDRRSGPGEPDPEPVIDLTGTEVLVTAGV